MSESHTNVPQGESEAHDSTVEHLSATENMRERQKTNERPNIKKDRFAPGYHNREEERSYLVRCITGPDGQPEVKVEYYEGLAAVPEYEQYLCRLDSNDNADLSTESCVLMIESIDYWSGVFGNTLQNYPYLKKHIWGWSPIHIVGSGSPASNFKDKTIGEHWSTYRTWFKRSSLGRKTNEGLISKDQSSLTLGWVPYRLGEVLPSPSGFMPGICETAHLQRLSSVQTPQMLILFHETNADYLYPGIHSDLKLEQGIFEPILGLFRYRSDVSTSNLFGAIMQEVHQAIIRDECNVIDDLNRSINQIDDFMSDDNTLRFTLKKRRQLMAQWRPYLHGMCDQEQTYSRLVQVAQMKSRTHDHQGPNWLLDETRRSDLTQLVEEIRVKRKAVLEHCESTFTMLMTTMSLIESEKAINEAEQVTKLTQLAFFFIPLTFVAGIYGMNLAAFNPQGPTVWSWAITSIGLSVLTYGFLYFHVILGYFRGQVAKVRIRRADKRRAKADAI